MSHQFKPGDLAILKTSEAEHLIGSVVELIEYLGSGEHLCYGLARHSNPTSNRYWWVKICSGQEYLTVRGMVSEGFCDERRLILLRGDFPPVQQKSMEAEQA